MLCCAIRNGLHCFAVEIEGGGTRKEGAGDQIHGPRQIVIPCGQAAHQPPGPYLLSASENGLALKLGCTVFSQAQLWIINPFLPYKAAAHSSSHALYAVIHSLQLSLLTSRWQQISTRLRRCLTFRVHVLSMHFL